MAAAVLQLMERSVKLFAVLASYLKNKPLKLLKIEEPTQDGYRVWNRLRGELQPRPQTRALEVAEALTNFPKISKGKNMLDYILSFERLAEEFRKLSGRSYDEILMVGILMRGIPAELGKHIYVNLRADGRYADIRQKLLEYERSTQAWTSTNVLAGFNIDRPTTTTADDYPQPMELTWLGKVEKEATLTQNE